MIKYTDTAIGFREVPDETSLLINISNCPHHCKGCHTPYLQQDIGKPLTDTEMVLLLQRYCNEITCVCFMGDGGDPKRIAELEVLCKKFDLKTALYTGSNHATPYMNPNLDYLKLGSYIEEMGGLDKDTTNQRLYKISNNEIEDLTPKFWEK